MTKRMDSNNTLNHRRFAKGRKTDLRKQRIMPRWRQISWRHQPAHDPMLVFNMSIFNFADGWSRTFNPLKIHEKR